MSFKIGLDTKKSLREIDSMAEEQLKDEGVYQIMDQIKALLENRDSSNRQTIDSISKEQLKEKVMDQIEDAIVKKKISYIKI